MSGYFDLISAMVATFDCGLNLILIRLKPSATARSTLVKSSAEVACTGKSAPTETV